MSRIKYINAGAGSGKTYRLSHTLSDRLTSETDKVLPSQIILTTFTRAAAAEFRKKSREVLLQAGETALAAELESSAIGTVHSVCEIFVKKYWYRLGLSPAMEILQDEDKKIYINQSIANLMARRPGDVSFFNRFRRDYDIVKKKDFIPMPDMDFWKDDLRSVIDKMTNYDIRSSEESVARSCAEVDAVFSGDVLDTDQALGFLKLYDAHCDGFTTKAAQDEKKNIAWMRKNISTLPALGKLWDIFDPEKFDSKCPFVGAKKGLAKFCQANPGFDADVFRHYLERQMLSRTFGEQIKEFIRKIFMIADLWRVEYKGYKEKNHILDFSDLEQDFLRILEEDGFEDVRKEIADTYRLIMVDEFQDSNPVQVRIFKALHSLVDANGGETIWVGDPKQSIYAFRGSDTEMIKRETQADRVDKQDPLTTSYRSRPALVHLANRVFLDPFLKMGLTEDEIVLPNVAREPDELPGRDAILHWNTAQGEPDIATKLMDILYTNRWKVVRKKRDDEAKEDYDRTKVVDISPKDVAILCRNGYEVSAVVTALRDAGIPVSATNLDMINWSECQLVQALLRYVANRHDSGAKADIMHLLYGLTSEDILKSRQDYLKGFDEETLDTRQEKDCWLDDDDRIKRLAAIADRVENLSVSQIISTLILELNLYRDVQRWDYPVARRQNLGILQQVASQYEDHCEQMKVSSNIPGYINYVHSMDSELKNEDTTSDTVKVMTYHKSKGLEWNVVIMYGLADNQVDEPESVMRSFFSVVNCQLDGTDSYYVHCIPSVKGSRKKYVPSFITKVSGTGTYGSLRKRNIEEETRLLYVGVTRARDYLVTTSKSDQAMRWISDCGCGSGLVDSSSQYTYPWRPAGEDEFRAAVTNLPEPLPEQEAAEEKPEMELYSGEVERNEYPDKYVQPSRCHSDASKVVLEEMFAGEKIDCKIASTDYDTCGTCIHNIFAAYNPDLGHDANVSTAERLISGMGLSSQLNNPDSIIRSIERLYAFLAERYGGEGLTMKETPFLLELDGEKAKTLGLEEKQVIRGEIDLVWVTDSAAKKCILVDYKSYHGSPNINSTDPKVSEHYSGYAPQLLAYKTALEADEWTVEDVLIYYHVQGRAVKFGL